MIPADYIAGWTAAVSGHHDGRIPKAVIVYIGDDAKARRFVARTANLVTEKVFISGQQVR